MDKNLVEKVKEEMKKYDSSKFGDDVYAEKVKHEICRKYDLYWESYEVWSIIKEESWSKMKYDPSRRFEFGDI